MSDTSKIDHDEARHYAEQIGVRDSHAVQVIARAYLDLRSKAEAFVEPGPWHARTNMSEEATRRLSALRSCLPSRGAP